jgi:hypothetical protein
MNITRSERPAEQYLVGKKNNNQVILVLPPKRKKDSSERQLIQIYRKFQAANIQRHRVQRIAAQPAIQNILLQTLVVVGTRGTAQRPRGVPVVPHQSTGWKRHPVDPEVDGHILCAQTVAHKRDVGGRVPSSARGNIIEDVRSSAGIKQRVNRQP